MGNKGSQTLGATMKMRSSLGRLPGSRIPGLAAVALLSLVWSTPAFGGKIHGAAEGMSYPCGKNQTTTIPA